LEKRRNKSTGKMSGGMSLGTLIKKQFTASKIVFNILFWAFHWGIFAYGWYVDSSHERCFFPFY
jgi:hypothetical protein